MNNRFRKTAGSLFLALSVLATGYRLSSTGRPLNSGVLMFHNLIAIAAALLLLGLVMYPAIKSSSLGGARIAVASITAILFFATIVTGGMLSIETEMPVAVFSLRHIMPFLTLGLAVTTLFALGAREKVMA